MHSSSPSQPTIRPPHGSNLLKNRIWRLQVLPKIKHFLWLVITRALSTTTRLNTRGMKLDPTCKRCSLSDESINHVFFECPHSLHVWRRAQFPLQRFISPIDDIEVSLMRMLDIQADGSLSTEEQLKPFWLL